MKKTTEATIAKLYAYTYLMFKSHVGGGWGGVGWGGDFYRNLCFDIPVSGQLQLRTPFSRAEGVRLRELPL